MEIIGSLIIAISQSILLYGKQLGISMLILMVISIATILTILYKREKIVNLKATILIIPIILISSTYMIFSSTVFNFTNILVIIALTIMLLITLTVKKDYIKQYLHSILKLIRKSLRNIDSSMKLTKKTNKEKIKKNSKIDMNKIISSIIIVTVVVVIVIILLASADIVFASIFSGIKNILENISIPSLIVRIAICIAVYFIVLSIILALQTKDEENSKDIVKKKHKDKFTIKMLLVALNIVYLVFCYIQITSLFINVNSNGMFNYAQYARTGFFQLMFVSFINFVIILISNKNNENRDRFLKIANSFLIVFTIIIVISSMFRMYMYESVYGLTYLRIFVYIILATELLIFIPTTIYVYNSKFDLLKWGGIIATFVYVVINFANLENIIINRNLNKVDSNVDIDYYYISYIATSSSFEKLDELQNKLLSESNIDLNNLKDLNDKTKVDTCKDIVNIMQAKVRILQDTQEMSWQEFNISKYKVAKKYDNINSEVSVLKSNISKLESTIRRLKNSRDLTKLDYRYNEMVSDKVGYIVYEVEKTAGDAVWQIEKTVNGGESYTKIKTINVKTPSKIEFFENGLGFLMIPDTIYCAKSDLYITTNSGRTFTKLTFPVGKFSLSNPDGKKWEDCYDYFFLPTREDNGSLTVLVSGGDEGGYNEGRTRAKYTSIDNGKTWSFVEEIYK